MELVQYDRGNKPDICKYTDGPKILQWEMTAAISIIKGNKAMGPGDMVIEMVQALGDFGTKRLIIIANAIYDMGKMSGDLSKSIFTALMKKPGAIKCVLHHIIRLISHITKVMT